MKGDCILLLEILFVWFELKIYEIILENALVHFNVERPIEVATWKIRQ